jgi:hypothetical protein
MIERRPFTIALAIVSAFWVGFAVTLYFITLSR